MSQKVVKKAKKNAPKARDYTQEMDDRCLPVALEILSIIVKSGKLPTSLTATPAEKNAIYFEYLKEMQPMLHEKGIGIDKDIETITKMIEETIFMVMESLKGSLNKNKEILINALFGLDDQTNEIVTVKMLSENVVRREKIREAAKNIRKEELEFPDSK